MKYERHIYAYNIKESTSHIVGKNVIFSNDINMIAFQPWNCIIGVFARRDNGFVPEAEAKKVSYDDWGRQDYFARKYRFMRVVEAMD